MTDLPMDPTEHPEEGLIHAWLDDALGAAEAERIEAHVRGCAECQTRVAEARGLIAGASRIVAALDDAPARTRPGWATSRSEEHTSELQSRLHLVCRLLLEKKKKNILTAY